MLRVAFILFISLFLFSCKNLDAQQINSCKEKIEQHIKAHPNIKNGIFSIKYKLSNGEISNWEHLKVTKFELFMSGQLSEIIPPQREYFGNRGSKKLLEDFRIEQGVQNLERDQEAFKVLGFNLFKSTSAEVKVGCLLSDDNSVSILLSDGPYGLRVLYGVQ